MTVHWQWRDESIINQVIRWTQPCVDNSEDQGGYKPEKINNCQCSANVFNSTTTWTATLMSFRSLLLHVISHRNLLVWKNYIIKILLTYLRNAKTISLYTWLMVWINRTNNKLILKIWSRCVAFRTEQTLVQTFEFDFLFRFSCKNCRVVNATLK